MMKKIIEKEALSIIFLAIIIELIQIIKLANIIIKLLFFSSIIPNPYTILIIIIILYFMILNN